MWNTRKLTHPPKQLTELQPFLQRFDAYIAGSYAMQFLGNVYPNDVDVYFRHAVQESALREMTTHLTKLGYVLNKLGSTVQFHKLYLEVPVSLVWHSHDCSGSARYGDPRTLVREFTFTISQAYIDSDLVLHYTDECETALRDKRLITATKTFFLNPLSDMKHFIKYLKRGYGMEIEQVSKLTEMIVYNCQQQ